MANPTPNALALINVAIGADILSADHRTNYASVQAEFNKVATLLAGGAAGQVLQAAGAASVQWATLGGLYRKATAKTVNTTVAETDLLNGEITVGAGVLGTSGVLRLTAHGDWKQNSGANADAPRFKLKLGATTLLDTGVPGGGNTVTNAVTRYGWKIVAEIQNLGAANSQWATINCELAAVIATLNASAFATGEGNYGAVGATPGLVKGLGGNAGAVDTTAAQALVLSVINASASANYEVVLKGALVEVI